MNKCRGGCAVVASKDTGHAADTSLVRGRFPFTETNAFSFHAYAEQCVMPVH